MRHQPGVGVSLKLLKLKTRRIFTMPNGELDIKYLPVFNKKGRVKFAGKMTKG